MSSESYYGNEGRRPGRRRRLLGWLFDAAMTLLTAVVAVAMTLTLCAPHIDPARFWIFPILGLVAPAVYVATVLLALYWIVRWRWLRAGAMSLLVVVGLFYVSLFWKPSLRRDYGTTENYSRSAFKVMTYNVHGFCDKAERGRMAEIVALIEKEDPDIVCLQEFSRRVADESELFTRLVDRYKGGYRAFGASRPRGGQAILSRYRILRSGSVLPGVSDWADLLIGEDTVRIFNNHLHSTTITASDDEYLTSGRMLVDTAREDRLRNIFGRFRSSSIHRAEQVDSIAPAIAAVGTRRIVVGDFNDTPMSFAYRGMSEGLTDAFSVCGKGYSYTYCGFSNTLRIDFVLASEGLLPLSYEVPAEQWSDHLPVVVRLLRTDMQ